MDPPSEQPGTSQQVTKSKKKREKKRKARNRSRSPARHLGLVSQDTLRDKHKKMNLPACRLDSIVQGFCGSQISSLNVNPQGSVAGSLRPEQTVHLSDSSFDRIPQCKPNEVITIDLSDDLPKQKEVIDLTESSVVLEDAPQPKVIDVSDEKPKEELEPKCPHDEPKEADPQVDADEISIIGTFIKTSSLTKQPSPSIPLAKKWSNLVTCSEILKRKYLRKHSVLDKVDIKASKAKKVKKDLQQMLKKDLKQMQKRDLQQMQEKDLQQMQKKDLQQMQKKDLQQIQEKDLQQMQKDLPQMQKKDSSKIGGNVYVNSPQPLPSNGLRPIIIDGNNVAHVHSNCNFSCKRLEICINYFKEKGHKVTAFVPQFRLNSNRSDNPELLRKLEKQGDVVLTPSKRIDGRTIVPYDDRFIVQTAVLKGGIIVTRDNYNDLLEENPAWAETIKYRTLAFTWVDDVLMFPKDPLGEFGPPLEQFLRFH